MIYGIDLGTTNSAVFAYDKDSEAAVDLIGKLVPSVWDATDRTVGTRAKQNIVAKPGNEIASSFKIDISLDYAVKASSSILRALKNAIDIAHEGFYSNGVVDSMEYQVVISVPAYFSSLQRDNTRAAAVAVGLDVAALINEPTAAALYYNRMVKRKVVIYDLGGGTFDVSIVDPRLGVYDVLATNGMQLGGDDLDAKLVAAILGRCGFRRHTADFSTISKQLKEVAESLKIQMQQLYGNREPIVKFDLRDIGLADCFENPVFHMTGAEYDGLVKLVFGSTVSKTKKAISDSGEHPSDLTLIFVGGSTKDPFLVEFVTKELGMERQPLYTEDGELVYDPDRIVAQGASYYAYLLQSGQAVGKINDVMNALGFMLDDGTMYQLVPKNSRIPCEFKHIVSNPVDCSGLEFRVYQGDSVLAENNAYLGTLEYFFNDGEQKAGTVVVSITFLVNGSGILTVTAKELGGEEKTVVLRP